MSSKRIMYCFWIYLSITIILSFFGKKIRDLDIIILMLIPIYANIVSHIEELKK
jgi:hypothetical protein